MREVRVRSWGELNERLYESSWQEPLRRFRSSEAFRGMGDASAPLRTKLQALGPAREQPLLRNFRKFAQSGLPNGPLPGGSPWAWLALAQHHGLPTRLVDWSFSPYVALHFATQDPATFDRDAAIWCVDFVRAHALLPPALRACLEADAADVFTADTLASVAQDLDAFDALAPEPFLVFFDPPSLDARIVNQFALFSLLSSATETLDDWLGRHDEVVRRVVIPAGLKWEVRDKLDQANVTERVLFPGLDGLSRWLARYYAPRS